MVPHKFLFTIMAAVALLASACTNDDDGIDNGKYLFLPQKISIEDSLANNRLTTYTYEENSNRFAEITDTIRFVKNAAMFLNTTYSTIDYDEMGRVVKMTSQLKEAQNDSTETQRTVVYTFGYPYANWAVVIINIEDQSTGTAKTYLIEFNEKQQAVEFMYGEDQDKFVLFEYDNKGNILKTKDELGKEFYFSPDTKRGIYREVNMPQWFMNIVLNIPRSSVWPDTYDTYGTNNNCDKIEVLDVLAVNPSEKVLVRNYTTQYSPFGYPIGQSDNLRFEIKVTYTKAY